MFPENTDFGTYNFLGGRHSVVEGPFDFPINTIISLCVYVVKMLMYFLSTVIVIFFCTLSPVTFVLHFRIIVFLYELGLY